MKLTHGRKFKDENGYLAEFLSLVVLETKLVFLLQRLAAIRRYIVY